MTTRLERRRPAHVVWTLALGGLVGVTWLAGARAGAHALAPAEPLPHVQSGVRMGAQRPTPPGATGLQPEGNFTPTLADAASLAREMVLDGNGTWTVRDGLLALEKAGVAGGPIRRPSALAVVASPPLRDAVLDVNVRSTAALPDKTPRRDVLLVVGYESPTRFYYVHISAVRDDVHNGIFLVADADRRRIDTESARAPLIDQAWHRVQVTRDYASGRIAVYWDGAPEPFMTATDRTLGPGRVGVGSFDDTAEFRTIRVTGRPDQAR